MGWPEAGLKAARARGRRGEVRAHESSGAAGPGRDGAPRHVGVRAVPGARHQAGDALPVRRPAGRAPRAGPEGPCVLKPEDRDARAKRRISPPPANNPATTGRASTTACEPCGRATCSSSGSSTGSAGTSRTWSTPCRIYRPAAWACECSPASGRRSPQPRGGCLVFGIFAALAEFERELIRERTVAGLKAARARGRRGGRKFVLTKAQVRLPQTTRAWAPGPVPTVQFVERVGSEDAVVAEALDADLLQI